MSKEIQKQSIPFGFRPGNETIVNDTDIIDEMSSVFTVENGVSLEINIPRFTVPTDGEVLDRVPDVWLKTRAIELEQDEDAEYWQLGYESIVLIPIVFGTLIILILFRKKRREG